MNEAKLRQRSLLQELDGVPLPKEVEKKAFELLIELLLAVVPVLEEGKGGQRQLELSGSCRATVVVVDAG